MADRRPGLRIDRNYLVTVHDLAMAAASFLLALFLRRGMFDFGPGTIATTLWGTLLFTGVCAVVFWRLRVYRGVWQYASLTDLIQITKAVSLAILIFLPLLFVVTRLETFPRSALAIDWFVLLALMGGARFAYRLLRYRNLGGAFDAARARRVPVLLAGAGDGAEAFIREMARNPAANYRVLGLLDDDRRKRGRDIHGIRVLGPLDGLGDAQARLRRRGERAQRLIVTDDAIAGEPLARLFEAADAEGLSLARLPKLTDFRERDAGPIEARPVAIEDLLGRPQTVLDRAGMRALIRGKRVLITGAGGSIGGELARQVALYEPARIALFDNGEFNLYRIDRELAEKHGQIARLAVLGDVRDRTRLDQTFARERPELVFHAAAFKHVPMVEANPNEGVLTNVVGTRNVADACRAAGVGAMVLISTDKAVNPRSVMGATKRIAECYCHAMGARRAEGGCRYVTVRFGNVLGSTGSVVPLFQRQIEAGGPITVTDPEVTRYFMTIREAVELVLQASAIGVGAPAGGEGIYVLDMGNPVRIDDLARQMIRLAGLKPDTDVAIDYIGLRPGEKLVEELFHANEPLLATAREGILCAALRPADLDRLASNLDRLEAAARARRGGEALALLRVLVPEYAPPAPAEAGRSLEAAT